MKEWNDGFNSFNSWKGLTYIEKYRNILDWENTQKYYTLRPPIEASLDPIEKCQLGCKHCNAGRYIGENRMTNEHLLELVAYLNFWGVQGICFGGGGEPSLHNGLADAIELARDLDLKTSVATNGIIMDEKLMDAYRMCRWVGVSVDAATKQTYNTGRRGDFFERVGKNIERLSSNSDKCDVAFKFLIFEYNQHEIFDACKLAKSLGVKDFHARPADFRHQGLKDKIENPYDIDKIREQFEKCHELADENFRVFTVVHKFNQDFTPKRKFHQCYASPVCIQLCADGNIYLCPDTRHMDFYKLGSHLNVNDIKKLWGSEKHYDLVFKNGCSNCSSRCTFSPYNEQCERLVINQDDPMCLDFV